MMAGDLRAEKRARRFWVSLVVGLLGLQLVIGACAITLATSSKGPVVLPDYHQAALDWDESKQRLAVFRELGWKISIEPSTVVDDSGNRAVQVIVSDKAGRGIDGLELSGEAYHHAHGSDVVSFQLESIGEGKYQSIEPMSLAGLWRFELATEFDGKPIHYVRNLELN